MAVEVPLLADRGFSALVSRDLHGFTLCHLTGMPLRCYKGGSSDFCEFTQPKLSPRHSCVRYKFNVTVKAKGEGCMRVLL